MKSVFILNAGSSSVKASLLLLAEENEQEEPCPQKACEDDVRVKAPIRLVTALAERLNTNDSVLHLTISVSAAKLALSHHHYHHDENSMTKKEKTTLLRSNSLQLTSRSTVEHHIASSLEQEESKDTTSVGEETEKKNVKIEEVMLTHQRSVELILQEMNTFDTRLLSSVIAIGHRVVHGGPFCSSVVINEEILSAIQNVCHLAPLYVLLF